MVRIPRGKKMNLRALCEIDLAVEAQEERLE